MRRFRAFIYAMAVVPGTLATACDNGIAPPIPTPFDARQALATVDPLAAVLDQGIFGSFDGALSFFDATIRSGATVPFAAPAAPVGFQGALRPAPLGAAQIHAGDIPAAFRGKTLIYDAAVNAYVPDLAAVGAPAAGVRLALYAWEPDLGRPSFPLVRVGYVDIGPAAPNARSADPVRFVVVQDAPQLVVGDLVAFSDSDAAGNRFGIQGSASDATTTVDIAVDGVYRGAAGQRRQVYSSTLSIASLGISSRQQLTFDQATAADSARLEVSYDGHTFTQETTNPGAALTFDGEPYARILTPSTGADRQYQKPDGTLLTSQEIADLNALLKRVIVAHFFWVDLAAR